MGYSTDFTGKFGLDRQLSAEHRAYLTTFSGTRRMARDAEQASKLRDPVRVAAGLDIGEEGAYFVGGEGFRGQDQDGSIDRYNDPPSGQPGLWCQWVPTKDGRAIEWDGGEKFYDYIEWIKYLVDHFLKPWGYVMNGRVEWCGEDRTDCGVIVVRDNVVLVAKGHVAYGELKEV